MSNPNILKRKIVIVGDGACGKTSLLYVFTLGEFPEEYNPTVFENYVANCIVDSNPIQLALWDTAGQEEYDRLRPLSYANANVILIGYSIDNRESLQNVQTKWIQEVHRYCPGVPVILVGLKKDLRRNGNVNHVQSKQAVQVAQEIGAKKYVECSSLTGEGVDNVFETAARISLALPLKSKEGGSGGCCVIS